jgi:hypothetical protein
MATCLSSALIQNHALCCCRLLLSQLLLRRLLHANEAGVQPPRRPRSPKATSGRTGACSLAAAAAAAAEARAAQPQPQWWVLDCFQSTNSPVPAALHNWKHPSIPGLGRQQPSRNQPSLRPGQAAGCWWGSRNGTGSIYGSIQVLACLTSLACFAQRLWPPLTVAGNNIWVWYSKAVERRQVDWLLPVRCGGTCCSTPRRCLDSIPTLV